MCRFDAFHMYGIIGSALVVGALGIQVIKRRRLRGTTGIPIDLQPKQRSVARYLIGRIIFGLGWALVGACPGPMYVLVGSGAGTVLIVLAAAILGTFLYGLVRDKLPH